MRRPHLALAVVLLLAAVAAGCLGDPGGAEDAEAPTEPQGGPADEASDEGTPDEPVDGNRTQGNASTGSEAPENETSDPPDEPTPRLPANVTLDGATVVERTNRTAVFRWEGTYPGSTADDGPPATHLNVPPDRWLGVDVTLTWPRQHRHLDPAITDEGVHWCALGSQAVKTVRSTSSSCGARPAPQDGWRNWTVSVTRPIPLQGTPNRSLPFTMEVRVEALEGPWGDIPADPRNATWPDRAEAAIRPGATVQVRGQCTTNFVFRTPDNASLYVGTSGHCAIETGIGTMVTIGGIPEAGRLVYCSWGTMTADGTAPCLNPDVPRANRWDNDFALIEVRPDLRSEVHPAMEHWGGPTGLARDVAVGDRILSFGNSSIRDTGTGADPDATDPARGYVSYTSEWMTGYQRAGPGIFGDSGSGILVRDGKALGIARRLADCHTSPALNAGTNLATALDFMEDRTDLDVEIATWPLLEDPPAPASAPVPNPGSDVCPVDDP